MCTLKFNWGLWFESDWAVFQDKHWLNRILKTLKILKMYNKKNKKMVDQISAEIFWYHKNNCIMFREYYICKISILIFWVRSFFHQIYGFFRSSPYIFCILGASIEKALFAKFITLSNETFPKKLPFVWFLTKKMWLWETFVKVFFTLLFYIFMKVIKHLFRILRDATRKYRLGGKNSKQDKKGKAKQNLIWWNYSSQLH